MDLELRVPEFEYKHKSGNWYLYLCLGAVVIVAISVWLENYIFVGFVIIATGVIVLRAERRPEIVSLIIKDSGIRFGSKEWLYEELESFSMPIYGLQKYFVVKPKSGFPAKIPVEDQAIIEAKLNNLLPQVEYEESFFDILERLTGI